MTLIAEAAELIEHFQWLTEEQSHALRTPTTLADHSESKQVDPNFQSDKHNMIREEMADIFLYLIRLADRLNIDLLQAAREKIEINAQKYPAAKVKGKAKKYTEY